MAEKSRRLLLYQPSAMQEPVKCEEVRERRGSIQQNALVLFRGFTQRHERELVKEEADRQHEFASTASLEPSIVEIRPQAERSPTNMGLPLSIRPFLL